MSRECRCTMAQKLVGDGCETCNPEMAADHMRDTIEDQLEEIASLRSALKEIANARPHKWEPDMRDQFQQWARSRAREALK